MFNEKPKFIKFNPQDKKKEKEKRVSSEVQSLKQSTRVEAQSFQFQNSQMTLDDDSSIYVGGLPYDASEDTIRTVFNLYGAILDVKVFHFSIIF
jgi:RNA recognition motif-containing protein